jgi:hypothetical protein
MEEERREERDIIDSLADEFLKEMEKDKKLPEEPSPEQPKEAFDIGPPKEEEPSAPYEERPFIEEPQPEEPSVEPPPADEKLPEEPKPPFAEPEVPPTAEPPMPEEPAPEPSKEKIEEMLESLEEKKEEEVEEEIHIPEEPEEEVFEEPEEPEEEFVIEEPPRRRGRLLKFAILGVLILGIVGGGGWFGYKFFGPKPTGSIEITSIPPSSTIFLNEIMKGKTPLTLSNLSFGIYRIRIEKENFETYEEKVKLTPEKSKVMVSVNLKPAPEAPKEIVMMEKGSATVFVKALPKGALVYIDGERITSSPALVTPGVHSVVVKKRRYHTYRKKIEVEPGEKIELSVRLSLLSGSIFIDSVPRGANIIFEGKRKGRTPILLSSLSAWKPYRVKLEKEGYLVWRGITFAEPGERTKIIAFMRKEGEKEERVHFIIPEKREEDTMLRPTLLELKEAVKGFQFDLPEIPPSYTFVEEFPFKMAEPEIKIEREEQMPVKKGPGYCFITSIPAGVEIFLDGRSIGKTPIRSFPIPAGKHILIAKKKGFSEEKKEIVVDGERTNFFNFILKK